MNKFPTKCVSNVLFVPLNLREFMALYKFYFDLIFDFDFGFFTF